MFTAEHCFQTYEFLLPDCSKDSQNVCQFPLFINEQFLADVNVTLCFEVVSGATIYIFMFALTIEYYLINFKTFRHHHWLNSDYSFPLCVLVMSSHSLKPHLSLSFWLQTGIISHTYVNICWSMITLHHFQILGQKVSKCMSTHGNGFVSADIGWLEWFKIYIWTLLFLIKFPFLNDILNRQYLLELKVGLPEYILFIFTH